MRTGRPAPVQRPICDQWRQFYNCGSGGSAKWPIPAESMLIGGSAGCRQSPQLDEFQDEAAPGRRAQVFNSARPAPPIQSGADRQVPAWLRGPRRHDHCAPGPQPEHQGYPGQRPLANLSISEIGQLSVWTAWEFSDCFRDATSMQCTITGREKRGAPALCYCNNDITRVSRPRRSRSACAPARRSPRCR